MVQRDPRFFEKKRVAHSPRITGAAADSAAAQWQKDGSFIERNGTQEGPSLRVGNPQVLDSRHL
ncbi:hypothetical protein ACNFIA_06950 [Pseudomonas sp. NY15437]|uniref:hypothetical protein n=1 Tax=Pseudomonas sp. NY15437 TaxID=3400360 RepID=UPI003A886762